MGHLHEAFKGEWYDSRPKNARGNHVPSTTNGGYSDEYMARCEENNQSALDSRIQWAFGEEMIPRYRELAEVAASALKCNIGIHLKPCGDVRLENLAMMVADTFGGGEEAEDVFRATLTASTASAVEIADIVNSVEGYIVLVKKKAELPALCNNGEWDEWAALILDGKVVRYATA